MPHVDPPAAHPTPVALLRTTESDLALPTPGRFFLVLGRALRLRCPHCGRGPVLSGWTPRRWGKARERCRACSFRFTRSDDRYFAGALLCNLLLAESLFVLAFVAAAAATWPDVPWDALTYSIAAGMAVGPFLSHPVAMVLWLAMDVLVRPVTREELE